MMCFDEKSYRYNPTISIIVWGQYVEMKSRKEASSLEFFSFVSMEELSACTSCLRHHSS